MFEPFHNKYVNEARFLQHHDYIRPNEEHAEMETIFDLIDAHLL